MKKKKFQTENLMKIGRKNGKKMKKFKNIFRRNTCRLCNEQNLELVIQFKPTPSGDAYLPKEEADKVKEIYPLDVALCNNCGFLQLFDVVSPKILYNDYFYLTSHSLGLVEHFKKYADYVINKIKPKKNELIVDIGSNDGTLLQYFKKRGMKVLGIEPAQITAKVAKKNNIDTIEDFFTPSMAENIKKEWGKASIITANNVFANIDNLEEVIKGINILLSKKGIFIFETGYMPDLINKNLFDNIYHEHLSYFSVKPLKAFFENNGMELIDINPLPTKGGTIRGFVQFKDGPRKINNSVKKYIDIEKNQEMDKPATFEKFYDRISLEKERLTNLMQDIKSKGKTITGYGASVGVTTILYEWGIGNFLDFLVVDNPKRYGLVSPGLKIPVFPSKTLYEKKPDYTIILSWRYSDPIIKNNKKYLEQGGKWIIPFEEFNIHKTY